MDKDSLLKLANYLWEQAFEANSYYLIIKQYEENYEKYKEEMMYSSMFYSTVYFALNNSMFMELAKLYDSNNNTINISRLLHKCQENIDLIPEYRKIEETISNNGQKHIIKIPYQMEIGPNERCLFKDQKIEIDRNLLDIFNIPEESMVKETIELTAPEYIDFFKKKYHALKPQRRNLIKQRNKIYAHNDENAFFDIGKMIRENPIYYTDIQALIDYALELPRFIIGSLTGIYKLKKNANFNDWEYTLSHCRLSNQRCE